MIKTDTPETDAYNGTHETHRVNGKTIYAHAEDLERQRDAERKKNARILSAVQILADQDFGEKGWDELCNQAAILLRNLLKNHD